MMDKIVCVQNSIASFIVRAELFDLDAGCWRSKLLEYGTHLPYVKVISPSCDAVLLISAYYRPS